jgi:hypothetical protein
MGLIDIHIHSDAVKLNKILNKLTDIGDTMATQEDIDQLTAQAEKINHELIAVREANATAARALRDQIAELEELLSTVPQLDLTSLRMALQTLDDANPDAPAPESLG